MGEKWKDIFSRSHLIIRNHISIGKQVLANMFRDFDELKRMKRDKSENLITTSIVIITGWKVSVFEVFLVCNFSHSDWIRRDTPYLSIFSPNTGKYGPEKLRIRTLFTQCIGTRYFLPPCCFAIFTTP